MCYFTESFSYIQYICNSLFPTGTFPDNMKIANVIPLYKNGDKCVVTDQHHCCHSFQRFYRNDS